MAVASISILPDVSVLAIGHRRARRILIGHIHHQILVAFLSVAFLGSFFLASLGFQIIERRPRSRMFVSIRWRRCYSVPIIAGTCGAPVLVPVFPFAFTADAFAVTFHSLALPLPVAFPVSIALTISIPVAVPLLTISASG